MEDQLLISLLILGHVLGDFAFQTPAMVQGKASGRGVAFARHTLVIALTHAVTLLLVFPSLSNLVVVLLIAFLHLLIDIAKSLVGRYWRRPFTWFALDQLAHAIVLLLAVRWVQRVPCLTPPADFGWMILASVLVSVLVFNVVAGSAIVSMFLRHLRTDEDAERDPVGEAGRWIGVLERLLILVAIWHGEWSAVGLVLTAKSIARFKELENRAFAEVYLVGTMTSVLVAVACGSLLRILFPWVALG